MDQDLDKATIAALEAMLLLMQTRFGLDRRQALTLASVCVDLRITQLVNGVHALLPHEALRRAG